MKLQDKHFLSIKKIYPDAIAVVKPITAGMVHDVYITECPDNKYVCRFSEKSVAEHNLQVSKILTKYDIPVPNISIYDCDDYYCETYPFIPGKTLHERLLEGLSGNQLDSVYKQMFDISYKISNIPYKNIQQIQMPVISKVLRSTIAALNPSERKLCHIDLHARNVVLDEQDNVRALLDLDAVLPEFTYVAHFTMMRDAQIYGYDLNRLQQVFDSLNIRNISTQIKAINTVTKLYHFVFPNQMRKQILKIRVK